MSQAIQAASETLVQRSRHGDQNAIGMIVAIRENKQKGNPKAGLAFDYMVSYIRKNPVRKATCLIGIESASFGGFQRAKASHGNRAQYGRNIVKNGLELGTRMYDTRIAAHIVAQGRRIDMPALRDVLAILPAEGRPVFRIGYEGKNQPGLSDTEKKMLQIGYIMGLATRIQQVIEDGAPLGSYSRAVAWELGE